MHKVVVSLGLRVEAGHIFGMIAQVNRHQNYNSIKSSNNNLVQLLRS